jgi:hypothetical protein
VLIVAPLEGYDSFVSLDQANAYHQSMGNAAWSGADEAKEAALRRATQYVRSHYRLRADALAPVHRNVAEATAELALRALTGELYADVDSALVVEETVGPITTKYAHRAGGQKRFAIVDDLLAELIVGAGTGSIPIYRA